MLAVTTASDKASVLGTITTFIRPDSKNACSPRFGTRTPRSGPSRHTSPSQSTASDRARETALEVCQRVDHLTVARPTDGGAWQAATFGPRSEVTTVQNCLWAGLPHRDTREQPSHHRGQDARQTHGAQGVSSSACTDQDSLGTSPRPCSKSFTPTPCEPCFFPSLWPSPGPAAKHQSPTWFTRNCLVPFEPWTSLGTRARPFRRLQRLGWTNLGRRSHLGHGPMDGARQHPPLVPGFGSLRPPLACRGHCIARLDCKGLQRHPWCQNGPTTTSTARCFWTPWSGWTANVVGVWRRHRGLLHAVDHPRRRRALGSPAVRLASQRAGR